MKTIAIFLLIILHHFSFAQGIYNAIEVLGKDSLKFYFNNPGGLSGKECAGFYRMARMDEEIYGFNGRAKDYYKSGQLAVDCYYQDNKYHGEYKSYYPKGQPKESGRFEANYKVGEWKYWYKNGQLKKVVDFYVGDYYVKEFYKSNGTQKVKDGNGEFVEQDIMPSLEMRGEIKDGRQHGKWVIFNRLSGQEVGYEIFQNGKFIEGQNGGLVENMHQNYYDYARSSIDRVIDYILPERFIRSRDCDKPGVATYNARLNSKSVGFLDYIYQNFDPATRKKGYLMVTYTISESGALVAPSFYSTLNDKSLEDELSAVLQACGPWEPFQQNGKARASTDFQIFQFYDSTYRILDDYYADFPVETEARFFGGAYSLHDFTLMNMRMPVSLFKAGDLAATVIFHIDESGKFIVDNPAFIQNKNATANEIKLYAVLLDALTLTDGKWREGSTEGIPIRQNFRAVYTIRQREPKLRIFSSNSVVK